MTKTTDAHENVTARANVTTRARVMPMRCGPLCRTAVDHGTVLGLALLVPLAALCLVVVNDERIAVRGWEHAPLPHVCLLRHLWGISCPACGLTRAVIHLVHGRWAAALECHRLSLLVFGLILVQIPYRSWILICLRGRPGFRLPESCQVFWGPGNVLLIVSGLLVGNWCWNWLRDW